MLPLQESQYIEFKSEKVKAADLAEEIVAFANSEGGEIWLGVEDDGTVSGLSRSYEEDMMNICRTACIPPLKPDYVEMAIEGKRVGRLRINSGQDKPYYTNRHRYFIRVGTTRRVASREELIRLFQAAGAIHYDQVEVARATLGDLDLGRIGDYFTRYQVSFFDEPESERHRLMRYADILSEHGRPTIAGLLIFGLAPERLFPPSGLDFAHFAGPELTADLLDKKRLTGPLPQQVDNGLTTIKVNLRIPSTIVGAKRVEAAHYPDRVFRELLVNACVHRNYSLYGANIRVFLFSDRLEVISPGRLPNTISVEKLSVGVSFARNPILVRFMENLGYVDKLGRGLPMVWQEARKLGQTVQFIESSEEFKVILPLPQV
jgi:ATP-dependent DNA helicase RecG